MKPGSQSWSAQMVFQIFFRYLYLAFSLIPLVSFLRSRTRDTKLIIRFLKLNSNTSRDYIYYFEPCVQGTTEFFSSYLISLKSLKILFSSFLVAESNTFYQFATLISYKFLCQKAPTSSCTSTYVRPSLDNF